MLYIFTVTLNTIYKMHIKEYSHKFIKAFFSSLLYSYRNPSTGPQFLEHMNYIKLYCYLFNVEHGVGHVEQAFPLHYGNHRW